ncbi:hypothetical protein Salat_2505400 [Sesamum alatum]|uniref:Uncharacterized protein n=1 Tax=Sesamum alatum TaxID=300844 RepID=A0AAE1XRQ2_9LAMI|nr:hypothetical protein Salat_2505400 [Sesamum alatum]
METKIKHLGRALRLTEDEDSGVRLLEELWEESTEGTLLFVVGRLLVNKDVNFEGLVRSLKSMLNPVKGSTSKPCQRAAVFAADFVNPGEDTPYRPWLRAQPGGRAIRRLEQGSPGPARPRTEKIWGRTAMGLEGPAAQGRGVNNSLRLFLKLVGRSSSRAQWMKFGEAALTGDVQPSRLHKRAIGERMGVSYCACFTEAPGFKPFARTPCCSLPYSSSRPVKRGLLVVGEEGGLGAAGFRVQAETGGDAY